MINSLIYEDITSCKTALNIRATIIQIKKRHMDRIKR